MDNNDIEAIINLELFKFNTLIFTLIFTIIRLS